MELYIFFCPEEATLKLATFRRDGSERIGLVYQGDARLFDLTAASERDDPASRIFDSMLALIDADEAGLAAARPLFDKRLSAVDLSHDHRRADLLAPLPQPRHMRHAMSVATHSLQAPRDAKAVAA